MKLQESTLLHSDKKPAIMSNNTAVTSLQQAHDFWKLYLQERKRALLTELRMIEQLQAQLKGQSG